MQLFTDRPIVTRQLPADKEFVNSCYLIFTSQSKTEVYVLLGMFVYICVPVCVPTNCHEIGWCILVPGRFGEIVEKIGFHTSQKLVQNHIR